MSQKKQRQAIKVRIKKKGTIKNYPIFLGQWIAFPPIDCQEHPTASCFSNCYPYSHHCLVLMTFFKLSKSSDKSLYPWSNRKLGGHSHFSPRWGHAATSVPGGNILIFGGMHRGHAKKDLIAIDTSNLSASVINAHGDIPPQRCSATLATLGHCALLYGGAPIQRDQIWDINVYAFQINTRQWSRIILEGEAPMQRSGHSVAVMDGMMIVWGGQCGTHYFNDFFAFHLYPSSASHGQWRTILAKNEGPSPRAGHGSVVYQDKLYIFGGMDDQRLYQDMWCYDFETRYWACLRTVGYIPSPRAYFGCTLMDGVIYVFGGHGAAGQRVDYLGDLCGFKISSQRWYMFRNMGTAPSPRDHLSFTSVKGKGYILGGSADHPKMDDAALAYILDSSKINYPAEPVPTSPPPSATFFSPNRLTSPSLHSDPSSPLSPTLAVNHLPVPPMSDMQECPSMDPAMSFSSSPSMISTDHLNGHTIDTPAEPNHSSFDSLPHEIRLPSGNPPPRPSREGVHLDCGYQDTLDVDVKEEASARMDPRHANTVQTEQSRESGLAPCRGSVSARTLPRSSALDPEELHALLYEIHARDATIRDLKIKEQWWALETALSHQDDPQRLDEKTKEIIQHRNASHTDEKLLTQLMAAKSLLQKAKSTASQQSHLMSRKLDQADHARVSALNEAAYYRSKYEAITQQQTDDLVHIERERILDLQKRLTSALNENDADSQLLQQLQRRTQLDQLGRVRAEEAANQDQERAKKAQLSHQRTLTELCLLHQRTVEAEEQARKYVVEIAHLSSRLADDLMQYHLHDDRSEVMIKQSQLESAHFVARNETALLRRQLAESKDDIARLHTLLSEKEEAISESQHRLEKCRLQIDFWNQRQPAATPHFNKINGANEAAD
ncbi:uncharacterized protein BYT42DRAFT_574896 [Radiomyces spectabilis]|uniref:uncharacterized protein n=1 Tax=Radiomyces spectabilis TaxID=64574 RepID=UPI00221E611E|nr:uncharacterized protein BYT42DRAFT_574896 [Radiomyces spectabilis]KAI8376515.1 hypothetical protein BYT42DRAFT_574896 [Radiomyces spectabilis]